MSLNRISNAAGWLLIFVVACVAPLFFESYGQGVLLKVFAWIALTASWVAFSGMTGYISLGHAVFYGIGGYIMALAWMEMSIGIILAIAGLSSAVFAFLIGLPALRIRGPYFVILTFGLAEFVKYIVVAIETSLGTSGRLLIGTPDVLWLCYGMLALAIISIVLIMVLKHSRLGVALISIREDETAATTLGVPVTWVKSFAFTLSAIIPAMVGALTALRSTYFEPLQMFSPMTSFTIVSMAIIGGSDRPAGPLLGACFIALLSEALWSHAPEFYMVLLGVLLLAFVLKAPDGIVGEWQSWLLRRKARA